MKITIDVKREDGDVIRLEGVAGLACVMQSNTIPIGNTRDLEGLARLINDMPIVSIRADHADQLVWMLASLLACVTEVIGEEGVELAILASALVNATEPLLQRAVPPRG